MRPENWQQIEDLFHVALERPTEERATFLETVCEGDQALRREVESLLAFDEGSKPFLEAPPGDIAARMLAEKPARSLIGNALGHYRLLSLLGAGGMGEVYLAEDSQLRRKAALKLLPAQFTRDAERLRRFMREARAASALNHPNIITIYEVGETGATHFIATEFVEGITLRQRIKGGGLQLPETLDIAIQISSALDAAHKAGIVHRDIKPENIMLRPDGLIKVLDFGLAKLTESENSEMDARGATAADNSTATGMVMGTPRYMSPEQVRGLKADGRTDVFSLGVVLYEMIAGISPFEGGTPSDVMAAILTSEPPPLAGHWPDAPRELEQIVEKALRKDRDRRYQVIRDLQVDLKDLKDKLEFEARLTGANHLEARGSGAHAESRRSADDGARRERTATSGETLTSEEAVSAGVPIGDGKSRWRAAALALAALIAAGAGFFAWKQWLAPGKKTPAFQSAIPERLTHSGMVICAAISPDGKYIVYAEEEQGRQSLRLRQTATDSFQMIVPPAEVEYLGITISHGGDFVYYLRRESSTSSKVLYKTPLLGGDEKKLFANVDSPITLSPDGSRLAFVRLNESPGKDALMTANADGGGEKKLYERTHHNLFSIGGPAWSPDGGAIAFGVENENQGAYRTLVEVRVADGTEHPIPSQPWEKIEQVAWLSDGSGLLVAAAERQGALTQIWSLPYSSSPDVRASPDVKARNITNELINFTHLSLTADSRLLVTVRRDRTVNIWVAPGNNHGLARRITSGAERQDGERGLAWTPDGKIVYRSSLRGQPNIWIMEADGTGNKKLSVDTRQNMDPAVSPDGKFIIWTSTYTGLPDEPEKMDPNRRPSDSGFRNFWRVDRDGGNLTQLTRESSRWFPNYSPDGKWLIYHSLDAKIKEQVIWKMPAAGGSPTRLTDKLSYAPVVSPDGKLIACNYVSRQSGPIEIAIIPFEGGAPIHLYPIPGQFDRTLSWTPDGLSVAYVVTRDGVSNIYSQALKGGPPQKLTDFKELRIFNFAWSPKGSQLALSRGESNSDVLLIRDPRE